MACGGAEAERGRERSDVSARAQSACTQTRPSGNYKDPRKTPDQLHFWNLQFLIPSLLFTWIPPEFSAIHSNNRTLAT